MSASSDSRLRRRKVVVGQRFKDRLTEIQNIEDRDERRSELVKLLAGIDSGLENLKRKRALVKDVSVGELQATGDNEAITSTHRLAAVLTYPLTFAAALNDRFTAAKLRKLLTLRLGKDQVKGKIQRVRKVKVTYEYEIAEDLRALIHQEGSEFELEVARLIGSNPSVTTGKPSKRMLEGLERR